MKHLKTISIITIILFSVSCGFFSKGNKDKPSILEIGKQLVKEAKKQQKKYKKDMDVEFDKAGKSDSNSTKIDAKKLPLTEEHFKVSLKNLDSAVDNLKQLNSDIKAKTKDGNLSTMDAFSLVGKIAGFATGYSTEYIDNNYKGEEKEEMKTAFKKIMGMYMIDAGINANKKSFSKENMANLVEMKKQLNNIEGTKEEKAQAMKDVEKMEQEMKNLEEYGKNPLKDYSKEDVEQFNSFKPEIAKKVKVIKTIIKEMGENLK